MLPGEVEETIADAYLGLDDDRLALRGSEGDGVSEPLLASVIASVYIDLMTQRSFTTLEV